jgi:hypothetical protein
VLSEAGVARRQYMWYNDYMKKRYAWPHWEELICDFCPDTRGLYRCDLCGTVSCWWCYKALCFDVAHICKVEDQLDYDELQAKGNEV